MAPGPEQPKVSPASGAALRAAIDSGQTRDKVPGSDPAAAPLGTDDEAAGTPVSALQAESAIQQETGRGPGTPPVPASTTTGAGPRTVMYMAGAILLLIVLLLIAL